jgi:uncharacterized protein YbjT (DUF2867 family)
MNSKRIAVTGATGRVGQPTVEILERRGHDVVPISRSSGVDVITAEGLADALAGVECIIDAATSPSPDQAAATEFFTTSARNLQEHGERAGVQRIVVVSIIGADRFSGGYNAAKVAQEQALLSGPVAVQVVRAAQFHEFVEQLVAWGTDGSVSRVPKMRTQLVAAETVAETLADVAIAPGGASPERVEIAGPRPETLVEIATLLSAHRDDGLSIEEVSDPADPDADLFANDGLLPGEGAILAGPTYEEWLNGQ